VSPLDLAVAWVKAGGGEGTGREALLNACFTGHIRDRDGAWWFRTPSGRDVALHRQALRLWKAAAHRAIAKADRMRGPGGGVMAPRVPRTVLVTEKQAAALDRGEAVRVDGAVLAVRP